MKCDDEPNLNICLVDCGTKYLPELNNSLIKFGKVTVRAESKLSSQDSKFDCFVFSGAPRKLSQEKSEEVVKGIKVACSFGKPILGICHGHQVLGMLHGSKIMMNEKIKKKELIEVLDTTDLFYGIKKKEYFQESHTESIDLPPNFAHLASSGSCENEAMKHESKPFWGIQFHPELSEEPGMKIFQNFFAQVN